MARAKNLRHKARLEVLADNSRAFLGGLSLPVMICSLRMKRNAAAFMRTNELPDIAGDERFPHGVGNCVRTIGS